ncbi:VirB4 family type IV secretion/conjugal transfer ATPase [Caulobacter sp. NIBR2454]|uniref:VirB4 family type IV secretion/conjugal transfer ATPase n=1 Tax=Caulobacter sp. NIBR2454 TaxID=3015996 RepID=UPI0022B6AAD6|nr:VirB4 family type IV secretion system protein [Caulobacter sp. NIBR2454]
MSLSRSFDLGRALAPREARVGDRLPYARHVDDATLQTRDGLLMQVLHLRGFAFETADTEELNYRKTVRETMLRSLASSRFAVYHHVVRRRAAVQLEGTFDDPFSAALDADWRARLASRKLYANDLFLTLVRRPLQGRVGLIDRLLRTTDTGAAAQAEDLRELSAARDAFLATLAPYGARLLTVYDAPMGLCSEPLEFIGALVNGSFAPRLLPQGDLGRHAPASRLTFGLDAFEATPGPSGAGRGYGAMVSMKDYPARSSAGLLDAVVRLPFEMVLTESFAFVERQATLDRMNLALRRMRAGDDDAVSLRTELGLAKDEVASGRAAFGEHHLTVMVRADSLEELDTAVAETRGAFTEAGAIAVREDVGMEPAFWAQFPGNFKDIARKALISSANFAGLASCHNYPLGEAANNHWGPAITVLETTSASPYYFNFHKGDLGNFTVIGPSGAGKTVLLTFLTAQARKVSPSVFYFDKDRGAEIFIRAVGGRYDLIRPGEPTGFNPLALEDTPANRAFLVEFIGRLASVGEPLTPDERAMIADAVDANFAQDPAWRRLRYFQELFRGLRRPMAGDLAARLGPWFGSGEHAWLFDNEHDRLDLSRGTVGFDMTRILDAPQTRTPAMMYLFHRVEQQLDGQPTLIVVDEGWKALDDEVFVQRIRDWEKTVRKRNGVVGFATQSASDALESRIASAIVEQAATQVFLPNAKAQRRDYIDGFGLSQHEYDLVRTLPDTSRCFLIKHGDHSVVARLNLTGLEHHLVVLSGTEASVRRLDALRATLGDDPAVWLPALIAQAQA